VSRRSRFALYGLIGLGAELGWTGLRGRPQTSLWMFPVYGLAAPLFEPLHERLRGRTVGSRALTYGLGITAAEYASGRVLRRVRGTAPWDYSHARLQYDGLIRASYVPVWALFGLGLERLHDRLSRAPAGSARRRCD
jgi:hypothetical protein